MRTLMKNEQSYHKDLQVLKAENAALAARLLSVDPILQQYEQRMHALKQELTGRYAYIYMCV